MLPAPAVAFLAPRPATALPIGAVDQVMRGETPPGKEGKALKKGLIAMAQLTGDAERAAAELKRLNFRDSETLDRYLERLEVCDGDLQAASQAHEYFEKHPDLGASFARLAAVTPGRVEQTLAHCEYLRQNTAPGKDRDARVKGWIEVLREEQLGTPEEVASFLAAPPPAPTPAPVLPTPAQAPPPVKPAEPPGPREIAEQMLQKQPVDGLSTRKLAKALDSTANYLNSLEAAQKELEQVLPRLKQPDDLNRYLRYLELSDGQNGQALQGFLHAQTDQAQKAVEVMLRDRYTVDDLKWLEGKLPKNADLQQASERYVGFMQVYDDQALFERTLQLPPEAASRIQKLEEVGMTCSDAVDDLSHLAQKGFKPEEFELLRSLRERAPRGPEALKALDYLRGAPQGQVREQRKKAFLKLVEVGDDPAEALKDLQWLSGNRPAEQLADATETYINLLGKVDRDQHDELRDCYQKLYDNAPPASSPKSWFRKPVTYEGAYGTLLEFDPDPNQALTDLRLLQKHASNDLRGGLKDLGDLFKMGLARDSEAVRTAYELLQEPPRWMDRGQLKKLVFQLANETNDLGLGARMARLLSHSLSEGEFHGRRKAFSEYLELGNSTEQTVGLLETAERCLPPTDDLLKIHPVLLEHNKNRPPEVVAAGLDQAARALARGKVDGQSSSSLFRTYLKVLCQSDRASEVEKLGEVLRSEGTSAYSMARIMEPMMDGCQSVDHAVREFHYVRDLRDKEWPDCPAEIEELAHTHAGNLLVLRQMGHPAESGARELMAWAFQHKELPPTDLLAEVGRRLVLGAPLEKARAEALEHFQNGGRIKDQEDHVVIGGIRIGKKESDRA